MLEERRKRIAGTIVSLIEWTPILGNYMLKEKCKKLETSTYDSLTGFLINQKFMEAFRTESMRMERYKYNSSLLMLDIDYFKKINDESGHLAGDLALSSVASVIRKIIRQVDIPGRYGGDEFAILLPHTDYKGAKVAAEKINRTIAEHDFMIANKKKKITVSIGLTDVDLTFNSRKEGIMDCMSKPSNLEDKVDNFIKSLIYSADKALYKAKNSGRNRVCIYSFA